MVRIAFQFCVAHWWHLLLLVPGALLVTILHEAAHALLVLIQGGTVHEFRFLPGVGFWGYVQYSFPVGEVYSSFAISIAPYVMWLVFCLLATGLCVARRFRFGLASLIYIWLFVVPLADIANAAFPWLLHHKDNDFFSAFGEPVAMQAWSVLLVVIGVAYGWGYWTQSRLYAQKRLPWPAYSILFVGALVAIVWLSSLS